MYYSFFGLKQPPFRITPDTDFFFEGGNRGAVLEALTYAITHGEGIVKVTGEVGSGKTMLCRVLQARLPASVETVYLANPSVSPEEILHAIAFELQLTLPRDAGRLEVMHALNEYLLAKHAEHKQVVVFVEESQSMPIGTLEEIRLLSNLETKQHKLLQIVLFGQPELDDNLRRTEIRQLRERITHSFSLAPLDADEVREYLAFRLQAAGYRGPDLFAPRVIRYVARATGGLTRRINIVADKALLAAFAENTHNVSLKHVRAAVADSEFSGTLLAHRPRLGFGNARVDRRAGRAQRGRRADRISALQRRRAARASRQRSARSDRRHATVNPAAAAARPQPSRCRTHRSPAEAGRREHRRCRHRRSCSAMPPPSPAGGRPSPPHGCTSTYRSAHWRPELRPARPLRPARRARFVGTAIACDPALAGAGAGWDLQHPAARVERPADADQLPPEP